MAERVSDLFEIDRPSPHMLLVAPVREERRVALQGDEDQVDIMERVNRPRSDVPAITHVDYSARIQTVDRDTNPRFHGMIEAFEELTGYGIVINTSFNVRGEPIVCTPDNAYRCFRLTELDYLVVGRSGWTGRSSQSGWRAGTGAASLNSTERESCHGRGQDSVRLFTPPTRLLSDRVQHGLLVAVLVGAEVEPVIVPDSSQ